MSLVPPSNLERFLPAFLTSGEYADIRAALDDLSAVEPFYLAEGITGNDVLQGDAWRGFLVTHFESGERRTVVGLIVSNSCDIDPTNSRYMPPNILFAPALSLVGLRKVLVESGIDEHRADSWIGQVRSQYVSSIFYLPASQYGPDEEMLVRFDEIRPHPASHFLGNERTKIFRLHQSAFWLLLLKLSIHFSRFGEGVRRFAG